jgi:hypothetical protein
MGRPPRLAGRVCLVTGHSLCVGNICEGVSKSFRTGGLERELQMVSATECSCIAILWVSLVSFAAVTLCVASQWVIQKVSIYFVIDSVRKLQVASSYVHFYFTSFLHIVFSLRIFFFFLLLLLGLLFRFCTADCVHCSYITQGYDHCLR